MVQVPKQQMIRGWECVCDKKNCLWVKLEEQEEELFHSHTREVRLVGVWEQIDERSNELEQKGEVTDQNKGSGPIKAANVDKRPGDADVSLWKLRAKHKAGSHGIVQLLTLQVQSYRCTLWLF